MIRCVVRGARNYPCQEFPGKRAPTIQLCRDPDGYVPIGNSPWRGPPVPIGTPMDVMEDDTPEDGRNILPPNKFPYIPPENDPDPGYPVAPGFVPPGVQTGPGPAPHQPWPYIPPPNQGPPPPPLTAWIPPAPYPQAWPPPAVPPGWATNPPNVFAGPYGPATAAATGSRSTAACGTTAGQLGPPTGRTTRTREFSSTQQVVPGCTHLVSLICGHRRIGWI